MIRHLISLLTAVLLLAGCNASHNPDLHIGLQLYTVRQDLSQDFEGTLQRVRGLGYEGVEFCNDFAGRSPAEVRQTCDRLGLTIFSNQVPYQLLLTDLDRVIEENKVLGVEYVTFPWMEVPIRPGVDPDKFRETVASLQEIGARLREAGLQLLYHNHDFEFALLPEGVPGWDYLFASSEAADVQAELDVCWAHYAGADPVALMKALSGRLPVLHMKDYVRTEQGIGFRPLGEGVVDLQAILAEAPAAGVRWLCVEQDAPAPDAADRFEGPETSFHYLSK